jgi:hypothetical protein
MASAISRWRVPFALVLLGALPVVAGIVRAAELASHPAVTADNARYVSLPLPILLHIYGGVPYLVLGAFQFVPSLRRRGWHRVTGRLLIPCGLAVGVSGVWMTLRHDLVAVEKSLLLDAFRLIVGSLMIAAMVLGYLAVRRRDIATHRAWMIRGYAIAMGAGTQGVFFIPWVLLFGQPGMTTYALIMGSAWLTNLAVAETVIRRRKRRAVPL